MKSLISILVLGLLLVGCQQKSDDKAEPEILAPAKVEKSFEISSSKHLKIQKSSLGKAFLLRASMKTLTNAPQWDDLKPLVVVFEQYGNKLGLFEVDTLAAYKVLDSNKLISKFKIISESESEIQFDWGSGFKVFFRQSMVNPIDTVNFEQNQKGNSTSLEVISSLIKTSEIKDNEIHVRQASRVRFSQLRDKIKLEKDVNPTSQTPAVFETLERAIEIDYSLAPYVPNPNFVVKESDPMERVGFFTTPVSEDTKSTTARNLITRWDFSESRGPVTYALSKHFPDDVRQAVKEGVLYWNKVLGKDAIRVIENFDPESIFPMRTVVVHWLPWEDAGAAWATLQIDPLTGEMLRGQIYITSIFKKLSKVFPEDPPAAPLTLAGMSSARTCQYPSNALKRPEGLRPAMQVQFMQDQLRHVMAHEVGHTLGLRHNFAASTQSALTAAQINEEKLKYESDPSYAGAELTTSIMDYIRGIEEAMIGRWILNKPLKYDAFALQWAVSPEPEVKTDLAFCTDEHILKAQLQKKTLYGCERFDLPANQFNRSAIETRRQLDLIVQSKFESIVDKLYPAGSTKIADIDAVLTQDFKESLGYLGLSAGQSVLMTNLSPLNYLYKVTGGPNENSTVHYSEFVGTAWDGEKATIESKLKAHLLEIKPGDLVRPMIPLKENDEFDDQFAIKQLEKFKTSTQFTKGRTPGGRDYQLTDYQKQRIEKYLAKGAQSFNEHLAAQVGTAFRTYKDQETTQNGQTTKETREILYGIGNEVWGEDLQLAVLPVLLAHSGEQIIKVNNQEVKVPKSLGAGVRNLLVSVLSPSISYTGKAREQFKEMILRDLQIVYDQLKPDSEVLKPTSTAAEHRAFLTKALSDQKIAIDGYMWASELVGLLEALEKGS